jgi:CTP:molybdopterin cytidylyltransferase MocA
MNVGVLLAAGASSRMGFPKALAQSGRESFLVRGVRLLWNSCDVVIVVLGSQSAKVRKAAERELEQRVSDGGFHHALVRAGQHGARALEVHFVINRAWRRGMLSSTRTGLAAARALKPASVMVLPVDHPEVSGRTIADLSEVMAQALEACRSVRDRAGFSYALVPRYRRRRGHPLVLAPALAWAIVNDTDAEDLSDAVRRHARLVGYLDVDDPGITVNRNSPKK